MQTNNFQKTPDQIRALQLLGGSARQTLLFGGSRSGKTFILIYAILVRALRAPGSRHIILRHRSNAVRQSVAKDTFPKVLHLAFPGLRYRENRTDQFILLPNGSEIWFAGLDAEERADKILGREFATIYFNECSEIAYEAVCTALTRLAQRTQLINRAYFDCNPSGKSHWTYKLFLEKHDPLTNQPLAAPENYAPMLMNPAGNLQYLPEGYLENTLENLPELQRRRFLCGEFLDDLSGALWNRKMLQNCRRNTPPELTRVVIGVDPAVTSGNGADFTGIVAAGRGTDGNIYVLEDASLRGKPHQWGKRVIDLYHRLPADRVVGEVNNGGELIEAMLRALEADLSYRPVRAARGKIARAEPVAALYEQKKVFHVGEFPDLEDEMCSFTAESTFSPDRLDALVWAVTELLHSPAGKRYVIA
ncbi:MAG: phage terminase large subunit [Lentisphaeria bacterium]|nr:phage terminase large subunit [Lentisphaeria bacterium]